MKIVHICQYYNDGYGYQENLLPRYQKKLGHDVKVITSDRMSYFAGEKEPKIVGTGRFEDSGVPIERLPIWAEFKGRFVWFKGLDKTLQKEQPDYIFHHGVMSPSLITCSKYKAKNPAVFLAADNHSDLNISARNKLWRLGYYQLLWLSRPYPLLHLPEPAAAAVNVDQEVMEQPVQNRRGEHLVSGKHLRPFPDALVRRNNRAGPFVPGAHHLEQKMGIASVQGLKSE